MTELVDKGKTDGTGQTDADAQRMSVHRTRREPYVYPPPVLRAQRCGTGHFLLNKSPIVLHQLIYTCSLTRGVDHDAIVDIAAQARVNNERNGLTGVLLCHEGSVLQVLEGERDAVMDVYDRILVDSRANNPLVLVSRKIDTREFPQWSMGLRHVTESARAQQIFKLCANSFRAALPGEPSDEVRTIGQTFARVNGLARYA